MGYGQNISFKYMLTSGSIEPNLSGTHINYIFKAITKQILMKKGARAGVTHITMGRLEQELG